jgi:glycerophosphoryl diester phosphodiesterase
MRKLFGIILLMAASIPAVWAEQVPPPVDPNIRYYFDIPKGGLTAFLARPAVPIPMVSYHRGGPAPGYPENAVETMDHALAYGYGIMEVDVAQLKDGTLVLMHDDTLSRTTTGEGAIKQKTWPEIQKLFLKDGAGTVTKFRIPKLEQALKWAVRRTILSLDIKRGTDFAKVAEMVKKTGATDNAIAIAYSIDQAKSFHRLAPSMPMSVGLQSETDIQEFDQSGIPDELVIAWTGTRLVEPSHYNKLHNRGWRVMLGTLGRSERALDNQIRDGKVPFDYLDLVKMGVDVVATDRFWAVHQALNNPNLVIFKKQNLAIASE